MTTSIVDVVTPVPREGLDKKFLLVIVAFEPPPEVVKFFELGGFDSVLTPCLKFFFPRVFDAP